MALSAENLDGLSNHYLVRNLQGKLSGQEISDASGIFLDRIRDASVREWISAAGILVSGFDDLCEWPWS